MTIELRDYTDHDLSALQQALAHWKQQDGDRGYCHTGDVPHRIYNGNRGRLPLNEIVQVWEQDGAVAGFLICAAYYNGFDAFVAPQHRGSSAESALVDEAYRRTRRFMDQIGRADKLVTTDVSQGDEVRVRLLLELGFEAGEQWGNLTECSLADPLPQVVLPEGYTIRSSTLDDYEQLAAVHSSAFGSNWTAELYRDQVMHKPGYAPEREMVVVAPDGRFAAFTVTWWDDLNQVGYFEPVGVHSDFQRKGLGRALLLETLRRMRAGGMQTAQVAHDIDNPASTGLYNHVGFRTKYGLQFYQRL